MVSNSTHGMAASTLAEIGSLDQGTLCFLEVRKKGTSRGRGDAKVVYGDDMVAVLVWTGFSYEALVRRSIKKLEGMEDLHKTLLAEAGKADPFVTLEDVCAAVQELRTSLHRVISEPSGRTTFEEDLKDPVWEPLVVDEIKVRGSKVYVGKARPEDSRAPKPGTIYVDGVKLGQLVLQAAPNGHWKRNRKPKTVVKDILRDMLPVGLYVRYALEPERVQAVKVGKDASASAVAAAVPIDPESIRSLFKVA
jgi:hypothetical protein